MPTSCWMPWPERRTDVDRDAFGSADFVVACDRTSVAAVFGRRDDLVADDGEPVEDADLRRAARIGAAGRRGTAAVVGNAGSTRATAVVPGAARAGRAGGRIRSSCTPFRALRLARARASDGRCRRAGPGSGAPRDRAHGTRRSDDRRSHGTALPREGSYRARRRRAPRHRSRRRKFIVASVLRQATPGRQDPAPVARRSAAQERRTARFHLSIATILASQFIEIEIADPPAREKSARNTEPTVRTLPRGGCLVSNSTGRVTLHVRGARRRSRGLRRARRRHRPR